MAKKLIYPLALLTAVILNTGCEPKSSADQGQVHSVATGAAESKSLVQRGDSTISHAQFDAEITRIPERDRLAFVRDGAKVDKMLNQLILSQVLADRARAAGYDQDPSVQLRMQTAASRELGTAWLEKIVREAEAADYEQLAREYYLSEPEDLMSDPKASVTHLLVRTNNRSQEQASQLAGELLQQIVQNPENFDRLVQQHSEDHNNLGRFTIKPGQTYKPFEQAAFALEEPGDISNLVQSPVGYHIIRLEEKSPAQLLPYEGVKPRLLLMMQSNHEDRVRSQYLSAIHDVALEIPEGAIETMLKRYFGEDLEEAPVYNVAGAISKDGE